MKKYYLSFYYNDLHSAGGKPKNDANYIFKKSGYQEIKIIPKLFTKSKIISEFFTIVLGVLRVFFLPSNIIIAQNFPPRQYGEAVVIRYFNKIKNRKKIKTILLVHDLEELRNAKNGYGQGVKAITARTSILESTDVIISHNDAMTKWLVSKSISKDKIIELEIFDYLESLENSGGAYGNRIIIAGSLGKDKAGYLSELTELNNLQFELYGPGLEEKVKKIDYVNYHGSYPSDQILSVISGSYGLIWDGDTLQGGGGINGQYQRYNNPYKVSLYLAAGFPIIIWKGAALSSFVSKHNIGFVIDDLTELPEKISSISVQDYGVMKENINEIGEKIRSGYFLSEALKKADKVLEENK